MLTNSPHYVLFKTLTGEMDQRECAQFAFRQSRAELPAKVSWNADFHTLISDPGQNQKGPSCTFAK
jgi:hypothetical protein